MYRSAVLGGLHASYADTSGNAASQDAKVAHDIGVDLDIETIHWLVLHVVIFEIKQSQLAALLVQVKLIGCCLLLEIVVGNQQFLI